MSDCEYDKPYRCADSTCVSDWFECVWPKWTYTS